MASRMRDASASPRARIPTIARRERSRSRSTISCAILVMARRTSSAPSGVVIWRSFPASQDRYLKVIALRQVYEFRTREDVHDAERRFGVKPEMHVFQRG